VGVEIGTKRTELHSQFYPKEKGEKREGERRGKEKGASARSDHDRDPTYEQYLSNLLKSREKRKREKGGKKRERRKQMDSRTPSSGYVCSTRSL